METTAFFDNIAWDIARQLGSSKYEIIAAVVCFTDKALFSILGRQVRVKRRVRLAVLNDFISIGPGCLCVPGLRKIGGGLNLTYRGRLRAVLGLFRVSGDA